MRRSVENKNKYHWNKNIHTLAKSIFSVQHPEYMSAPFKVSLALTAASTLSNVLKVKEHRKLMIKSIKENVYTYIIEYRTILYPNVQSSFHKIFQIWQTTYIKQ